MSSPTPPRASNLVNSISVPLSNQGSELNQTVVSIDSSLMDHVPTVAPKKTNNLSSPLPISKPHKPLTHKSKNTKASTRDKKKYCCFGPDQTALLYAAVKSVGLSNVSAAVGEVVKKINSDLSAFTNELNKGEKKKLCDNLTSRFHSYKMTETAETKKLIANITTQNLAILAQPVRPHIRESYQNRASTIAPKPIQKAESKKKHYCLFEPDQTALLYAAVKHEGAANNVSATVRKVVDKINKDLSAFTNELTQGETKRLCSNLTSRFHSYKITETAETKELIANISTRNLAILAQPVRDIRKLYEEHMNTMLDEALGMDSTNTVLAPQEVSDQLMTEDTIPSSTPLPSPELPSPPQSSDPDLLPPSPSSDPVDDSMWLPPKRLVVLVDDLLVDSSNTWPEDETDAALVLCDLTERL